MNCHPAQQHDIRRNLRHFDLLRDSDLSHSIVKRGADPTSPHRFNKIREVGFNALGREFRLVLSPKKGLLHPKFKAVEVVDEGGDGEGRPSREQDDSLESARGDRGAPTITTPLARGAKKGERN